MGAWQDISRQPVSLRWRFACVWLLTCVLPLECGFCSLYPPSAAFPGVIFPDSFFYCYGKPLRTVFLSGLSSHDCYEIWMCNTAHIHSVMQCFFHWRETSLCHLQRNKHMPEVCEGTWPLWFKPENSCMKSEAPHRFSMIFVRNIPRDPLWCKTCLGQSCCWGMPCFYSSGFIWNFWNHNYAVLYIIFGVMETVKDIFQSSRCLHGFRFSGSVGFSSCFFICLAFTDFKLVAKTIQLRDGQIQMYAITRRIVQEIVWLFWSGVMWNTCGKPKLRVKKKYCCWKFKMQNSSEQIFYHYRGFTIQLHDTKDNCHYYDNIPIHCKERLDA